MRAGSRAYAALRDDIVEWRLPPGAPVAEVEQAQRLGLSRTPVREALARLMADGLVQSAGSRGAVVADISPRDVIELFNLRIAVESQIARLAAQRRRAEPLEVLADELAAAAGLDFTREPDRTAYYAIVERLDEAMTEAAASVYLGRAMDGVRLHLRRLRRVSRDNPPRLAQSTSEHLLVVRAVLDRDETLAVSATTVHLKSSLAHILSTYHVSR